LQRALDKDTPAGRGATLVHFGFDRRVHALGVLGNVLWVLGFPDQAVQAGGMSLEEARAVDQALPLCVALAWSGFVMYLAGSDLAATEQRAAELIDRAAKHSLDSYHAFGLCLSGLCRVRQGDSTTGLQLVASGIDGLGKSRYEVFVSVFLGEMAHAAATAGRADDGVAALDQALARVERNAENWCLPELLRLKGELLLMQSEQNSASAAEHFTRSLDCGRRQQALSWELRTVISIARLQRDQGRKREARDLLVPLFGRFTEGFGTADLQIAKRLLDELG
jgi:predicted ATPase